MSQASVCVQSSMDAHLVRGPEQLDREAILHERFATAQSKTSRHRAQSMSILAQLCGCFFYRYRDSLVQSPRIRIMAVKTTKLTAGRPSHNANSGAIDCGSCGKGMQKSHVSARECSPDLDVRHFRGPGTAQL